MVTISSNTNQIKFNFKFSTLRLKVTYRITEYRAFNSKKGHTSYAQRLSAVYTEVLLSLSLLRWVVLQLSLLGAELSRLSSARTSRSPPLDGCAWRLYSVNRFLKIQKHFNNFLFFFCFKRGFPWFDYLTSTKIKFF